MQGEALIHQVKEQLFQPETGLYLAPIRHHSPACAWAVRAMIRELKPARILIEAPHDLAHLIPHLLDPDTVPPVAIASLLDQKPGPRLAAYYPFCGHSPEWVALREGAAMGAELRFIDLGSDAKMSSGETDQNGPRALVQEQGFDSGDYVRALSARLGCRDGYELWDHLFETRLGENDWRGFLGDVGAYCAALRAATPEDEIAQGDDPQREAHMAACLRDALAEGTANGPVICVIGGFHAWPLLSPAKTAGKIKAGGKSDAASYLIRYGYKELDALMGYGAGLPQPAYYQALWDHAEARGAAPSWPELAHDLIAEFATQMRDAGYGVSVPAQVELLRSAETLARLRGRPGALRHDLFDGLTSSLLKGEASSADVWRERFTQFLRGHALGEVSDAAGQPPVVADARARARRHRFDVGDGQRRERSLDIRRKPGHLAASRFAHAMSLLETGFATRSGGPDFLNSVQTGLLFEHWEYAWSPRVEGQLIEAAVHGDTLPAACMGKLYAQRAALADDGRADDLPTLIALFKKGLLAGLGVRLTDFLDEISGAITRSADFPGTARTMLDLHAIETSRGPLSLPEGLAIEPVMQQAFARMIYLCDELPKMREEAIPPCLDALRLLSELLRGAAAEEFDTTLFDAALDRVSDADPAPELLGAITAIGVESGRKPDNALPELLDAQLRGSSPDLPSRLAGLRGVLAVSPSLLWTVSGVLECLDAFLNGLTDDEFLEVLPHLRLTLSALSPREADQVAEALTRRHGGTIGEFTAHHHDIDAQDAAAGALIDAALRKSVAADGLEDWIIGGRT
ncbi:hypothetical protein SAMN04488030_2396 [Aliiroseovarius halocynthiae]|uniref:ChaN family lipoprotein n=1 Tax=Aliiroseovarius halocynthiae TaxID=985055 RepID=A0A545SQE6_9RHOB|nr:DUF5682 family protein [Aliiroseovarius halocynthiae]TQV67210.1 hypothetical protein FIL88_11565 [Aliiroseovarius halocynthiae]SMR82057.1 hypothetical protein SAMN04488030_2396 [Aliiroseovarius halocynthiae]